MAVINESGVVVNLIVGTEDSPKEPGTYLVAVDPAWFCTIGFTWNGERFLNNQGEPVPME